MDFLQESLHPERGTGTSSLGTAIRSFGNPDQGRRQERQASMQRATLMMADRKRRLTENQEDYNHRRSASSLTFGPSTISPRSSLPPPHGTTGTSPVQVVPQVLPSWIVLYHPHQRPRLAANRESREIILPAWQSDSEVTRCPICKTNFGFWYRKHHCRKCEGSSAPIAHHTESPSPGNS